jgi:4'-phosphopantetheinyl transferase
MFLGENEDCSLGEGVVDGWCVTLADVREAGGGVLSEDELVRADRFRFEKDRRRFVAARSALRQVLGRYLRCSPGEVGFSYQPTGKPQLAPEFRESRVQFNLSHSGEFALIAVTLDRRIGVDIEVINAERAWEDVAERFFSAAENRILRALPAGERELAFFQCWTRKEAYVKAVGAGLALPLSSFDVAFGVGVAPAVLRIGDSVEEAEGWSLFDVECPVGYVGAVAVEGRGLVRRRRTVPEVRDSSEPYLGG